MLIKKVSKYGFFPHFFRNFAQPACGPTQGPTRRAKIGYVNNFRRKNFSAARVFYLFGVYCATNSPASEIKSLRLKKTLLFLVGGAAALYFLARFQFSKKANFILQSVKPGGTLFQPLVNIKILVQNPTNQRVVIKSIVGSVFVDDKFLAYVSSFGEQVIQGNAESVLNLTARPGALGVFNTLKQLVTQPIGNIQVRFSGTANIDGVNVPIEQTQGL